MWGNIAVTQAFLTLSEVIGHMDLLEAEGRVRERRRRRRDPLRSSRVAPQGKAGRSAFGSLVCDGAAALRDQGPENL